METERMSNKKGRRFKSEKRKLYKKKMIIILLILIVIIGIVSASYFYRDYMNSNPKETEEEKVEIMSNKFLEEKMYKEMKIKDIKLTVDKVASYFKCKIENETDNKFQQEEVFVIFVNEDNSELARFKYQITPIEANTEEEISIVTTNRLTDAYDFYIEEVTI